MLPLMWRARGARGAQQTACTAWKAGANAGFEREIEEALEDADRAPQRWGPRASERSWSGHCCGIQEMCLGLRQLAFQPVYDEQETEVVPQNKCW
jgi:hypothetical protein